MELWQLALHTAQHGAPQLADVALTGVRMATGAFFAFSGCNKLFNPGRHATIRATMEKDRIPLPHFMEWWVPGWEFSGGILLAVGLFGAFSAAVLAFICLVACLAEAKKRVAEYQPINEIDRLDDYLYLPEVTYILLCGTFAILGAGPYSVDALLF